MTIEVTHYYGVHQGGTKDYHLYLFAGPKEALIVKRYGKTGTAGQILKVPGYATGAPATREYNKLLNERGKKGYDMRKEDASSRTFSSMAEALQLLPSTHRSTFANADIAKIEGTSPKGQTGSFDPMAEERAKLAEQLTAQAKAEEQEAEMAALKSNPKFGMF